MRIVRYTYPSTRNFVPAVASFRQSPWSGLESEIDRLFESALGHVVGASATDRFPVDIFEDKDNAYVRAELPGVTRADIGVEVVDGYLAINATRKIKTNDNEETFSLNRSVALPENVEADKVAAAYENGVLTVTLPKKEEAKPRKIAVSVN
jgi:HSP20 family protein